MPKNVAAEVAHSLRRRIDSGEWSDTRRLPNERELAAEYSVARNTLRSAIDKVAADGTVLRQVGRGTFLRRDAKDDFLNIIQKLSGVSPIDMMAVRRIIEPRAAALAATNASAGALEEIAAVHSASVAAFEIEAFENFRRDAQRSSQPSPRNATVD
jgi:DNA-binding FadR family transcriptional regulator